MLKHTFDAGIKPARFLGDAFSGVTIKQDVFLKKHRLHYILGAKRALQNPVQNVHLQGGFKGDEEEGENGKIRSIPLESHKNNPLQ